MIYSHWDYPKGKNMLQWGGGVLSFNSKTFKDVAFSTWKHTVLYRCKVGVFHANQISMCLDPHMN